MTASRSFLLLISLVLAGCAELVPEVAGPPQTRTFEFDRHPTGHYRIRTEVHPDHLGWTLAIEQATVITTAIQTETQQQYRRYAFSPLSIVPGLFQCTYGVITYALTLGHASDEPMRYGCRPAGKPAFYDVKYPGTYNARRDNLQGFWKGQFGHTHGLIVVNAFYENVNRHKAEGRDLAPGEEVENLVLEFKPRPTQDMLVACLWSKWTGPNEPDLLSFAAITDEPPAEVAAAGHDRCIVPIKPENVDAWLNPANASADRLLAILEDRERPYYEHRMAA